ncbi:hypothetical protein J5N97_002718 [Dioscorea zingiberensis]|uniref:Uncharacterized protein n=1 Tax=Dioscorea zingiberensis TaxID=325984 RepID=A0A9D5HQN0_9LILI|nr:hypothetical protein J5N97_002718 [Dioscorea zingiberensis]
MATLILFLSFLFFTVSPSQVFSTRSEQEIKLLYEGWLVKHHKNYNGLFEKEKRYNIFKDNLKFIDEHNAAGNHSITLGLTVFADLTNDEYRKTYLGFRQPAGLKMSSEESNGYHFNESEWLPDFVDWRLKRAVVPVKNQGRCNSCWAFSAIAAIEGLNAIVTGRLISLSEQEIVDCYKGSCNTGFMEDAFNFIIRNGGINTDQDYPYRGRYVGCDRNKLGRRVVSIDDYNDIPPNNESYLKKVVAHQPVSVGVDTSSKYFQFYKSGIFDESCGTNLDHAVTVIARSPSCRQGNDWLH